MKAKPISPYERLRKSVADALMQLCRRLTDKTHIASRSDARLADIVRTAQALGHRVECDASGDTVQFYAREAVTTDDFPYSVQAYGFWGEKL